MKRLTFLLTMLSMLVIAPMVVHAQPATPAAEPTETLSERYRPGRIIWQPCAENAALECGTLTLPIDYTRPQGETFGMAVVRARTTDQANRLGVLFTNPGGPGISGVDQVISGITSPLFVLLRQHFDVIGFDPRGVGRSRPVTCVPEQLKLPDDQSDESLAAYFDGLGRRYAAACLQQDGMFVTKIGTNNVARDMDILRRALGEQQITYASGSYGTELGAVYASLFPRRVRAMALDGGVNPVFRDGLVEATGAQMAGFELELQRVDVLCRRDPACRLRETGVVAAFDQLTARLNAAPHTAPNGVVLTGNSVSAAVSTLLYTERLAPITVRMLADALNEDYRVLLQVLPLVDAGVNSAALTAVRCNDYGTRRKAADYLPIDAAVGARNSRFFGRLYLAYQLALCSAWPPTETPTIRSIQQRIDTPILLVMNDFDPATPPADMRMLAAALGMERSVVRYRGGGHTFPKNNACVANIFVAYLLDRRIPDEGTSCAGQAIPFGAQLTSNALTDDTAQQLTELVPAGWGR